MDREKEVAVLLADVSGSTKLYETEGDKVALEAIARCIEVLRQATETGGGRVVNTVWRHSDDMTMSVSSRQMHWSASPPAIASR